MPKERDLLTLQEVATELGLPVRTVQNRVRAGQMRGEHPRLWMVPRAELERWRNQGKLKPGPKPKEPTAAEFRRDMAEHQEVLEEGRRRIHGEPEE
jgi:excisionase family DNA binding protein